MGNGQFQAGNPGRPKGAKNKSTRKADEAFELVFDAMQTDDKTSLLAWAKENPTEFYKLFAKKLTTTSDNRNHNVSENVSEEQARLMAEEYIAATRSQVGAGQADPVHGGDAAGLQAESATPADSPGPGEGRER